MRRVLVTLLLLATSPPAHAGLYYSGETIRDLPARWSGYLPDHRALRAVGLSAPGLPASPLRDTYADAAARLEATAKGRPLTADEAADLGALLVRLGKPDKAVEVLRPAARQHPDHFHLAANLGTAWQLAGDLDQAAVALDEAVRLAPPVLKAAESAHRRLVLLRKREGRTANDPAAPDDLFGVRFVGEPGKPEPGGIVAAEKAKLPGDAVAVVQRLALGLPADGRLLWLLAELANASGDVRTAANLLDGCVTEFNMGAADLRARRQRYRAAADALDRAGEHQRDRGTIAFKSARALARGLDPATLPAVKPDGVNRLPWAAVAETEIGPKGKAAFLPYVDRLDGRTVTLAGYMAPPGRPEATVTGFLLTEYPVGCWFCETPGPTQVLTVDLADGATTDLARAAVRVTGTLRLNRTDPERFPFTIENARVGPAD